MEKLSKHKLFLVSWVAVNTSRAGLTERACMRLGMAMLERMKVKVNPNELYSLLERARNQLHA